MKLVRWGLEGQEKPGILDAEGQVRDLSAVIPDISHSVLSDSGLDVLRRLDLSHLRVVPDYVRLGAPVGRVGKIIAIGLNYADHAAEAGLKPPAEPIVFQKATSSLCGPYDPIEIPRGSVKTDWEIELGVVIGRRAKYIAEADALDHVAGYCTVNDVSERHLQTERGGQWTKGKSHDTFCPVGPWLVTKDEVPDPQTLPLWCSVDGQRYQDGTTAPMIFTVAHIIAYLSQMMTLEPGDIIATGTPPGVGMGIKPDPIFLKPGQIVECEVVGLGKQRHLTIAV
ncbi:FAA-hydrolase [Elstera cyanobacteriorum]|uniref:Fumarylacetoacetase-like C-terminal domain-containing protein n=1 Tax=Elstera cyanobacteriorum TaxID=2022747 RepID=A0A255XNM6_9PROT|nr:fumarylacetoacetate hydrolase family protein [Elstera cyanobacteriorum]OYQ18512.1 hypothetical protein CHR90_09515 [Elstera cyanobacteriorum]GFZ79723.1 FAA-hydrolase [Elstera cyanobacteriorum]